jgi:enterochelin esterase family protein
MHPYNDVTYDAIKQKSGLVRYEKVYGGHDWLSWRSGLVNGLVHLMPV